MLKEMQSNIEKFRESRAEIEQKVKQLNEDMAKMEKEKDKVNENRVVLLWIPEKQREIQRILRYWNYFYR